MMRPTFLKKFIYLFLERERGREGERDGEKQQLPLIRALTEDQTPNPGMCPDQESNRQPLLCWTTSNALSHTGQGVTSIFKRAL